MAFRWLHVPFYIGLSLFFLGYLFMLMHWPGGYKLLWVALPMELLFDLIVVAEIVTSTKASLPVKALWASAYLLLPVLVYFSYFIRGLMLLSVIIIAGNIYLTNGRKRFLHNKYDRNKIHFDSIDM